MIKVQSSGFFADREIEADTAIEAVEEFAYNI